MINFNDFLIWATGIANNFGYLGIFAVALISASTVFLPTFPLSIVVFTSSSLLNPVLVGIVAGVGSATGELTSFFIGYQGEHLLEKHKQKLRHIEKLFQRNHSMLVIYVISAFPFALMDVAGLFCGLVRYPVKNFYIASILGKTTRYLIVALAGYYGISYVLSFI